MGEGLEFEDLEMMHKSRFLLTKSGVFTIKLIFCLIPQLILDIHTFIYLPLINKVYYFTSVSLTLTTFSLSITLMISWLIVAKIRMCRHILRIEHVLFEVMFISQIIITIVYWATIHDFAMNKYAPAGEYTQWVVIFSHVIPFATLFINFLISNYYIPKSDFRFVSIYFLIYAVVYYIQTMFCERTPYPILTFEDSKSWINAGIIILLFTAVHIVVSVISGLIQKQFEKVKKD
jgi:hypothetical protein